VCPRALPSACSTDGALSPGVQLQRRLVLRSGETQSVSGRLAAFSRCETRADPLPDPTAGQPSDTTATSMTNGLVSNVSPARPKLTNTNMTNGIVSAEKGDATGLTLTVTYDGGGKSFRITVPSNAPIVRYVLADRSAAAVGSAVMIKTNPGDQADLVTVGKGVMPPM
jgi:hypothetical protein